MQPERLTFNGKFLTARPSGVHRVALELLKAVDRHRSDAGGDAVAMRVLVPPHGFAEPQIPTIELTRAGYVGGQLWEQVELPRVARGDLIVSLCNIGPAFSRRAVTLIHDAQVYLTPQSYSSAFRMKYRLLLPLIGRRHRRIITVSAYSREQLATHGVAPRDRISVVHNGVDHILAEPADYGILAKLDLSPQTFVVALANTQRHKNVGLLLRVFASPALQSTTLLLVGGAGRNAFAAEGHIVPPNVRFAGQVSDGELRAMMERALCLAFPSTTEGFGLPPLEGMLLGCPAVVAPCGALPEVCGDAVIYCGADDPDAWRDAIVRLRDHPEERAALSARGVAHAGRYTWDAAGRRLLDILYQEMGIAT